MAKRSYQQYCGLAAALDVVGERWALLVVRDLVPGPRRFTDLFEGLPGIATDVLADRLRSLEAAGAVEQVEVRHPVPAKVYALTARGHELAAIAGRLATWGMPLLPDPRTADTMRMNPRWALQTMTRRYTGGLEPGEYRFTVDGDEFRVDVVATTGIASTDGTSTDGTGASIAYGHGTGVPVLEVRCSAAAFFQLLRRPRRKPAIELVHGSVEVLDAFLDATPITVGEDSPAR